MKCMILASAALACAVALSACASNGGLSVSAGASPPTFNVSDILKTTVKDIKAADKDAATPITGVDLCGTHVKDCFAHQCYSGALAFIDSVSQQNGGDMLPPKPIGVVSGFQDARDIVKGTFSSGGPLPGAAGLIPPQLVQACGPLALDVQNDIGHITGTLTLLGVHL